MSATLPHLPDLPDAGYASRRQKETSDAIMIFMRSVERNRILLLSIVLDGIDKWRKTAGGVWRGLLIDRDVLDSIYRYFEWQAGPSPAQQLLVLKGMEQLEARQQWDRRASTVRAFQKSQQAALQDLAKEHANARKGKKWYV